MQKMAVDTEPEWASPPSGMWADDYSLSSIRQNSAIKGVELRIHQKNGNAYDRVCSDYAEFSADSNKLYAPGEAEITLDVPVTGDPGTTYADLHQSSGYQLRQPMRAKPGHR